MSDEKKVVTQQIVNLVHTMRSVETVLPDEYSEGFTAGYMQALDDLVAWLKEELDQ